MHGQALVVYSRHDCSLCEELLDRLQHHGIRFETRDIGTSREWYQRYRTRIPVVQLPDGSEIDPPFSEAQLTAWTAVLD